MADTGGVFGMNQNDQQREELADRLGITLDVAENLALELRTFEDGDQRDLFGRFRALLRKAYENQPGMKLDDFDKHVKAKYLTIRAGDAQLLLNLFADDTAP